MKNKLFYLFFCLSICALPGCSKKDDTKKESDPPINIAYNKRVDMTYEFVGDEKDKKGFAQGFIKVDPLQGSKENGYYLVYFANDDDGILQNYDEFASFEITGDDTSFYVKDGTYLPNEATMMVLFESDKRFLDAPPHIQSASSIIRIPSKKQLKLKSHKYRFGATSDVHMNYEDLGFGSLNKWDNTLKFYSDNEVDHLLVTGDMTGDTRLELEYQTYVRKINESNIDLDNVYECLGNHGNTPTNISLFNQYTVNSNQVHPYENSPYFSATIKDDLYIFMAQEITGPSDSASYDNFSKKQIDWLEGLLKQHGNTNKNIFLIEHSPFLNFGPGDRHNGDYKRLITFKESYTQTMRLKQLLTTYKDVIMLSGHTHLTFYERENYSNENDSFCRMIHVSSGTQTSSYNYGHTLISDTDGRKNNSPTYGSEGYVIDVYDDYILFKGYNISTNKVIPAACYLLPTKAYGGTYKEPGVEIEEETNDNIDIYEKLNGSGTKQDPYQISNEEEFALLTNQFKTSTSKVESEMFGYGKYFIQTANLNMESISSYNGTNANGSDRYTFAGNYNGNGYYIKVSINGTGQQSVFPYCYGMLTNLTIKGSIVGGICAQPVRALYGKIINCVFDTYLTAQQTAGIVYSHYGYVYNVYVTGSMNYQTHCSSISVNDNSTDYHNIYYNYSNTTIKSQYGTSSSDLEDIASKLNDRTHEQYNVISQLLNGIQLCDFIIIDGSISLKSL